MAEPAPQRVWRAACSFCGAPVEFRSAASPMAVCTFCKSTLVREDDALRRIGQSAELFDDHSPLALGTRGRYQGEPFLLVGRVQMASGPVGSSGDAVDAARWSEWHALFDNGQSAWLSEDNGAYVMSLAQPALHALPDLSQWAPGQSVIVEQQPWVVGSVVMARVLAAQGELAFMPDFQNAFRLIELRNTQDQVLSLDTSEQPPRRDLGQSVTLASLDLSGTRDEGPEQASEARIAGRGLSCPNCGNALTVQLSSTQSIVCGACDSVVDISQGLGAAMAQHQHQNGTTEPLVPLGTTGRLRVDGQVGDWQVVGYLERCDVPAPGSDDEVTFWREYLLYHRQRGFAFLVDAEDGWSVVRPITGVPADQGRGRMLLRNIKYRLTYSYQAQTSHVLGEFYWRVKAGQRDKVSDYVGEGSDHTRRLSREEAGGEITWSQGQTLTADEVMKAFGLTDRARASFERDVKPLSSLGDLGSRVGVWVFLGIALVVLLFVLKACDDDCDQVRDRFGQASVEYQQCRSSSGGSSGFRGGSHGGFSSGGFHK